MVLVQEREWWPLSLLESKIESDAVAFAKTLGIKGPKLAIINQRSWPDRTFMYRGHILMIEFKQKGEKPTPLQQDTIDTLIADGFDVTVCDDLNAAKVILSGWKIYVDNQHQ